MYKPWEIGTVLAVLSGLSVLSFANYTYAAAAAGITTTTAGFCFQTC